MGSSDPFFPSEPAGLPPEAAAAPAAPEARPEPAPAGPPAQPPATAEASGVPVPAAMGAGVLARLKQAREELGLKNVAGAMAIYEEVLAQAPDRADVLATASGDLGVTGHASQIIELIAARYDAQRHGPAAGINLLQAYLAVREPESAQHVLDLLFGLNRPELQERLLGFSNVIADMMLLADEPAPPAEPGGAGGPVRIELVSISKPIWYYGLESIPGLLPAKEGRLRRVAFGQLAVLGLKDPAAYQAQPEDELGRLSRGIPLWLAEMLGFSANYATIATVATLRRECYGHFGAEWAPEHIRQLIDSSEGAIDYVITGALRQQHGDYEVILRLWEVKKFRERKSFTARWTPATADQALGQLQSQLRTFMEFTPYPAGRGLVYAPPKELRDYVEALAADLTFFLGEKKVLPAPQLVLPEPLAERVAALAGGSEFGSLLALGLLARARRAGIAAVPDPVALADTPVVASCREVWGH